MIRGGLGRLRNRVTIQKRTVVQDSYGEATEVWSSFASVDASIEPIAGREFFAAKAVQAETTHRIVTRHVAGVVPTMRVLWGTRRFDIREALNIDERNEQLHLMCVEATDG